MIQHTPRAWLLGSIAALTLPLALAGCSTASSGDAGGPVEISFLVPVSGDGNTDAIDEFIAAFEAENDGITVKLETQPAGAEGDNLTKTKLSTGEMADVFLYNSGALLQALNPDATLTDLSGEAWVDRLQDSFKTVVSGENGLYGAPWGTTQSGAILYSKTIYEELGLEIPVSWDEFVANNEKIKAAGKIPVMQTYGDTFSSQLFVLGDAANVLSVDPEWAEEFTAGNREFAEQPALAGFEHLEEGFEKDWWNEDFASAKLDEGMRRLALGEVAHYPMLSGAAPILQQNTPENVDDVGLFAVPATDADDTSLAVWMPNAVYIPKTTQGAELEAAKKLVAFVNSPAGCELQNKGAIAGPYAIDGCELPDDVPQLIKDIEPYFESGENAPALEFLSPIKGPNLENILVEVGSGIRSAKDGAALYDEDVVKQAQQLGLSGW
ncbi:ABC transporter substrate-binding protein [Microbacterium arborescens]